MAGATVRRGWAWAVAGAAGIVLVAVAVGAILLLRNDTTDTPARLAFASQLAALCDDTRTKVEALGRPAETPIETVYGGTVRLGRAFASSARELDPPAGKAQDVKGMLAQFGLYYDGLEYALAFYQQGNQVAFVRIVDGALSNLDHAERIARSLGAPECARRPFE
jgi:hypothetical protein